MFGSAPFGSTPFGGSGAGTPNEEGDLNAVGTGEALWNSGATAQSDFNAGGVATLGAVGENASVNIQPADFASAGVAVVNGVGGKLRAGIGGAVGLAVVTGKASGSSVATWVSAGSAVVDGVGAVREWPESVTLRPTVDDDGWGGVLSYQWVQLSGPATATIVTPTAQHTEVLVDDTLGVYVFSLTVTRADDGLVGVGRWRVVVYQTAETVVSVPAPTELAHAIITVNGVPISALINQVTISEQGLNDSCSFSMPGASVEVFNEIIVERNSVRLFAGICMAVHIYDQENNIFSRIEIVGHGWHLTRKRITKTYVKQPIGDILADLLLRSSGNITGTYIAANLPYGELVLNNVTPADAIEKLSAQTGAGYRVDYFKRLHFNVMEEAGDPLPITQQHSTMKNLTVTREGSQTANRVTLYYDKVTVRPVVAGVVETTALDLANGVTSPIVDGTIEVDSLDGYGDSGGYKSNGYWTTEINGNLVRYSGTDRRRLTNFCDTVLVVDLRAAQDQNGQLDGATDPLIGEIRSFDQAVIAFFLAMAPLVYYYSYALTLVTPYGETRPVWSTQSYIFMPAPANAVKFQLMSITFPPGPIPGYYNAQGGPWDPNWNNGTNSIALAQIDTSDIRAINVYAARFIMDDDSVPVGAHAYGQGYFIGTLDPKGGHFIDTVNPINYEMFPVAFKSDVEDGEKMAFFLTGCAVVNTTNESDGLDTGQAWISETVRTSITVNDAASQAALAALLGGGDDGVIEITLDGGVLTDAEALNVANEFLSDAKTVNTTISVIVRDDDAHPGQTLSMNMPAPYGAEDLKIQTVQIQGFEGSIPHEQSVVAAVERIKLEDLLRK